MGLRWKSARGFINLVKLTFSEWNKHDAPRMGAALAFYTILSLAPLVILVVSVVALAFGHTSAHAQITQQVRQMVGSEGALAVETVFKNSHQTSSGILGTVIGIATLLFGASGVFVELRSALNALWDVKPRDTAGVWGMLRERFLSFGMVLAIGFLLLVSLTISAALATVGKFFGGLGIFPAWALEIVNFVLPLLVVTFVFVLIFRFVADVRIPWRPAWIGAFVTSVLFTLGKTGIGLYLGKAGVGSAYGAAGSVVVLVVWVYYSAQIFFFGAEFTHLVAGGHEVAAAKPVHEPAPAEMASAAHARPLRVAKVAALGLLAVRLVRSIGPARH